MISRILPVAAAGCIVALVWGSAGCESKSSSSAPSISGKVLYKGRPVTGGDIAFHPKKAGGIPYSCKINADGSFSGTLPAGTLGEVIVTVQTTVPTPPRGRKAPPPQAEEMQKEMREKIRKSKAEGQSASPTPVAVPEKYAQKNTSPLTWTLTDGSNTKDFDLTD